MSDVKWIKITTDMFDNRKIKAIRKLPEGNNIILIWVMLLSLAGRCNASGMIFLTENIPYTNKMLADELDFEESVICIALDTFEKFGMIVRDESLFISVNNWAEYQSVESMDKIREKTKDRVQKHREQKKLSFSKTKTNVSNLMYILSTETEKYSRIMESEKLLNAIKEWMDYKDNKKPKVSNHYDTEIGIKKLLKQIINHVEDMGEEAVIEAIDLSVSNNYMGIVWDVKSGQKGVQKTHGNGKKYDASGFYNMSDMP